MNNSIKMINNLNKEASLGNFPKIKNIFDKNKFNQQEIDEAFRECIHNYNKNQKDSYVNCINFFLKKTTEINFQNSKFNNTTILMYSIDQSQDTPTDLIISCSKDDLDMNLTDNNGENILFHLVNNDNFSDNIKIEFIKDFFLGDYNLYSKNNKSLNIPDILKEKGNLKLLEEIKNKIKDDTFDQNKLTLLYNDRNYKELLELIEKYEKKEKNEKQYFYINCNSIKYNKLLIELKKIISLNISSINFYQNFRNHSFQIRNENKEIIDIICKMMNILRQVVFDEGGGNNMNNNNKYSLCLIINKMIMYYQLDYYNDFYLLKNRIEISKNFFLNKNIFINLYKYLINIDMMIQRCLYSKANDEFNILKENVKKDQYLIESIQNYLNNPNNNNNNKSIKLPNDLTIDIKNIKILFNLYQIFINSFLCNQNDNQYNILIKELKNIKIDENYNKDKNKERHIICNNNNNLKSFQKYLLLKLNYLNIANKNPNSKISYKISDKLMTLNIEGNSSQNELNKIYYYHYQGIISLKNGNYNVSKYFFLKCLQIISTKTSFLLIKRNHFYPIILFNLALSYFYLKKYKNAIRYLYFLSKYSNNKSKFFINYKYVYYRLGLSNLEILLNEDKNCNMLYKSYINKKFILKTTQKSSFNEINEIIEYFKKTFILIKNNPNDPIYFSTLINLVFCLIVKENYTEAIFYLKKNKCKDPKNLNILRQYLIQCYIYLNKLDLAEKMSEEIILDDKYFKSNNSEIKFFERLNSRLVSINGFKINLLLNLIKIYATKKKVNEMQKYLSFILDSIKNKISNEKGKINTDEEIPTYIINIFVYYYLLINRRDLALDIMKKRKIKEILISPEVHN